MSGTGISFIQASGKLYDLENDPDEFVNLASNPEYDGVKKRLATYLPTENAPPAGKDGAILTEVAVYHNHVMFSKPGMEFKNTGAE